MDILSRQTWIKSPIHDLLFVFVPLLMVLILSPIVSIVSPHWSRDFNWLGLFVFVIAIDMTHGISMWRITYFNRESSAKFRTIFWWAPVICTAVFLPLYLINPNYFYFSLSYFGLFHFTRQQFGVSQLYSTGMRNHYDKAVIYASTIAPVTYWHFFGKFDDSFGGNSFLLLRNVVPDHLVFPCKIILAGYLIIVAVLYMNREIKIIRLENKIKVTKNVFIALNLLSWLCAFLFFAGSEFATFAILMGHGVTYLSLVRIRHDELASKENRTFFKTPYPFLISCWCLAALMYVLLRTLEPLSSPQHPFVVFLMMPTAVHYFIDGFIWKGWRPRLQS